MKGMMNNTTTGVDLEKLQEMTIKLRRMQQMLKMKEQIDAYLDKIETVWTYAPLIIMAFGLTGKRLHVLYK